MLKAAFAEGRLDQDEFTERLGQVQACRTYGELAALTADLPVGPLGALVPVSVPAVPAAPAAPELPDGTATPAVDAPRKQANGLAVVSLLCGILATLYSLGVLAAVPALVTGWLALTAPNRRGKGLATAGMVLGLIAFWRVTQ